MERSLVPEHITVVAATKTVAIERIAQLPARGVHIAGENRVQELLAKYRPIQGLQWHFVGNLQTNKVKHIIDLVTMIQSVDRQSLALEISRRAKSPVDVLIQVNIGAEPQKGGVDPANLDALLAFCRDLPRLRVRGLMSVLPINAPAHMYQQMRQLFDRHADDVFDTLSMGMSDDYQLAIEHGATMVRLGRALFGDRQV